MGLKLEAGKRYVTRSGWITPPIEEDVEAESFSSMRFYAGDDSWSIDGRVFHVGKDIDDLPDDYQHLILEKMQEFGGGFVRALATAYINADPENRGKIRNTFREYWSKYADIVAYDVARADRTSE